MIKFNPFYQLLLIKEKKARKIYYYQQKYFLKSFKPIISNLINTEVIKEEDTSITIIVEPLGLSSNAGTFEQAKKDIIYDIKIYIDVI